MKKTLLAIALAMLVCDCCLAQRPAPTYKKLTLSNKFYAEGSYYGDFNRDGKLDVVAGPFWFEGPDFTKRHEYREPKAFDPKGYSDNFLTYAGDFNGDGWPDILVIGYPGAPAYWYENPHGKEGHWKKHLALDRVDNESPMWVDLKGDGRRELLYNTGGSLGYATFDPAQPEKPWVFHPITPKRGYFQYTHGIGCGDIRGDGHIDILEKDGWWEPPAHGDGLWTQHPFKFADEAAQMYVYDVDGDGLSDVITVWHCHHYGLVWYKQIRSARGEITWQQHVILPPAPDVHAAGLRISQMHSVDLADISGNGLKDIITGKRFWAHGPTGDVEPDAAAVLYWFELRRDKAGGVQFIPHMIDDDSGVGTQVTAVDLNGDGIPDVIVANKKGIFVHLSQPGK